MVETLELVVLQFIVLAIVGVAVLAPVASDLRQKLLPAAPVFGAVLIAVITNWTCRWLSIRWSLPIIAVIVLGLFGYGIYKRNRPHRIPRAVLGIVALGVAASIGGLAVTASPQAVVNDTDAVAPTYIVDQFYFAGVSSYLLDHPLLPGPTMTNQWIGNDPPATAPAADTVANRIRFGQSAVAAALSVTVLHSPYTTVNSISLLWLILLALTVVVCGSLLGMTKKALFATAALVSGSFFVVAQPLQGQHDGLLGTSIGLLALVLSIALLKDSRYSWPLALVGAGLAATYSEYFSLLAPALALLVVVGPRSGFMARLNLISGRWAASALLAPWAFVWLAQSFKLASRLTDGPQPFAHRSGWDLFRAYLGIGTFGAGAAVDVLLSAIAVAALVTVCVGWAAVIAGDRARGALIGLLLGAVGLEIRSVLGHAGNLQYRVVQLSVPLLLLLAGVGWDRLLRRARSGGRHTVRSGFWPGMVGGAVALVVLSLVAANLTTVGLTLSYDRVRNQHIAARFIDDMTAFVQRVGADRVTVVAPELTDLSAISLALIHEPDVEYATVLPTRSYVGMVPHWNAGSDPYYVVGPGATVVGNATFLVRDGRYAIVHLNPGAMIVSPWLASPWPRVTWMRGFPCGSDWSLILIIRGSVEPATFKIATEGAEISAYGFEPVNVPVNTPLGSLRHASPPVLTGAWSIQTIPAPETANALVALRLTPRRPGSGATFPVVFGASDLTAATPNGGPGVTSACLRGDDSGMDGYDRELTYMRSAP